MHNQKRNLKRTKVIWISALVISMVLALGPLVTLELEHDILALMAQILMVLSGTGVLGIAISLLVIFVIFYTKDNQVRSDNQICKDILNHFDATHK